MWWLCAQRSTLELVLEVNLKGYVGKRSYGIWSCGEQESFPPMTSCIALVPKRNECFLGVRHRFKAKEKLWWNETWLPLRNSQSREGERYVRRHNEVRWAASAGEQRTGSTAPRYFLSPSPRGLDGKALPDSTTACRRRKAGSQEMSTSWFRHQQYKFPTHENSSNDKMQGKCVLEWRKRSHVAQSWCGRFPKDHGAWAEPEGQGENVSRGRPWETNCSQLVMLFSPKSPSNKHQLHKSRIQVALMAVLFTTSRRKHSRCSMCRRGNKPIRMRLHILYVRVSHSVMSSSFWPRGL